MTSASVDDPGKRKAKKPKLDVPEEGETRVPLKEPVKVTNADDLVPLETFKSAPYGPALMKLCGTFAKPTIIQSYCWPAITTGRDVIGIAETGSGKTLAFVLPILDQLLKSSDGTTGSKRVRVVVLAPTRELAQQTFAVIEKSVRAVCIYGGVSRANQLAEVKAKRPLVVVGTPGRLIDLIDEGAVGLSKVSHLVLDEADRMLDLGFAEDIRKIVGLVPKERQTIMFSATWPTSIQKAASEYLRPSAVKIVVGQRDSGENRASTNVQQLVTVIRDPMERDQQLLRLLKEYHRDRKNRILIFALYKKEAARLESFLGRSGWKAGAIHGDMTQADRNNALAMFKEGTVPLLVATDVASRGLDIPNVEYVINYTFPLTIEDYIHRIGRTGRGGKQGISHTFFTDLDKTHAGELVNVLKMAGAPVPEGLLSYGCTIRKKQHKEYGAFYRELDADAKPSHVKFDDD